MYYISSIFDYTDYTSTIGSFVLSIVCRRNSNNYRKGIYLNKKQNTKDKNIIGKKVNRKCFVELQKYYCGGNRRRFHC